MEQIQGNMHRDINVDRNSWKLEQWLGAITGDVEYGMMGFKVLF